MLEETLIEVTRRQRHQDELENFVALVKDEVESLLGQKLEFRIRAGSATSNGFKAEWKVGASKFEANFFIEIRPREATELYLPDIKAQVERKPEGLLWTALSELGYEQFAWIEEGKDAASTFCRLRNLIEASENFVAFFEIPLEITHDC